MSVIEKKISIRALRKVVWQYFSDADLLAAWLLNPTLKFDSHSVKRR